MPQQTPNVFTYPRQEPGTLGHFDLVEPLRSIPRDVAAEVKGLAGAGAYVPIQRTAWCIQEIVGHLARCGRGVPQAALHDVTQTDPILEPYDQDEFAARHGYLETPIEDLLEKLRYWRAETAQLLTTLVNWNWARTGRHLENGRVSIRQIVEHMVEHEQDHLENIRRLRAAAPAPF